MQYLALIFASTSLTLLAGIVESSEPWLEMPIWIVLISILIFWILVEQLRQKNQIFNRAEPSSFSFKNELFEETADAEQNPLERAEKGIGISVEADLDYYG